ncbi:transcriptional regulator YeiL [Anaerotignum sp.]|uniref:transcriptional regulator YeiL n=1 Tax=Anaerotignum sp. TaxID=2039241 RepID=UPI0027152073|nr:transcriptional regulator YeiL [Anaerotignum sp.]
MKEIQKLNQQENYQPPFPLSDFFNFDIRPYVTVVQFEPDETILQEGEKVNTLYYLISGRAKLFLSHENGRISLINFMNAPCFIGEIELLEAQKLTNGIKAITTCICFAINASACKGQLLNDNKFLRYLCVSLSKKAIGNTSNYAKNQSYTLEVRLATFILTTSNNRLYREKHTEVAEFLGVTYRHLLYVIAEFVKKGILKKTAQGYYIENVDRLREVADKK